MGLLFRHALKLPQRMKVLLVDPPKKRWEMMGDYVSPPLGLAQLAAVLEENNIEVSILDCNASEISWQSLETIIGNTPPALIGATAYTSFFYDALKVMQVAKGIDKGIITVLGGPHVTFTVDETLTNHRVIDFIVRGEGEITLVDLIRCLQQNGGDLHRVKGIAFRENGGIVVTPEQDPVDLERLSLPAYHLLPMSAYRFPVFGKFATVLASRGCPFRCTFCSEWRFWGGRWRPRNIKSVVDEIELLSSKYDIKSIWFGDDCFNVDGQRMETLCGELLKRELDVNWYYQGRADFVIKYQELLPLQRRAGNLMVQIGIESSTAEELAHFQKNLQLEYIREATRLLKENDIVAQGLIIIGTRADNPTTISHKLRFMKWLDVDFPIFTVLTPFPGSTLYEEATTKGWIESHNYHHYDMAHFTMPTATLSRRELAFWYQWCYKSYYFDPIKLIKGLFSKNDWKRRVWQRMLGFSLKQMLRAYTGLLLHLLKTFKKSVL